MSSLSMAELVQVCQQMQRAGQTPTVAMLRAKAPVKVSLAQAIEAIKRFQANPRAAAPTEAASAATSTSHTATLEQRVATLEQQVAQLIARLEQAN